MIAFTRSTKIAVLEKWILVSKSMLQFPFRSWYLWTANSISKRQAQGMIADMLSRRSEPAIALPPPLTFVSAQVDEDKASQHPAGFLPSSSSLDEPDDRRHGGRGQTAGWRQVGRATGREQVDDMDPSGQGREELFTLLHEQQQINKDLEVSLPPTRPSSVLLLPLLSAPLSSTSHLPCSHLLLPPPCCNLQLLPT